MVTRILVPLDGSALSEQALPCAMLLARGLPAELVILRAVSMPSDVEEILDNTGLKVDAPLEQLRGEADDYLRKIAGQIEEAGLRVHPVVRQGSPAEAIVDYAEHKDIQQIVMATHGYSGLSRWRHGSVAERVLQSASEPVLMVCAHGSKEGDSHKPKTYRRILVSLDGSSIAEQVLPPATSIAQALDAEIILFRVAIAAASGSLMGDWYLPLEGTYDTANQVAKAYLGRVAERLQAQGIRASTATRTGGVAGAIINYVESNQIDLVAMCTHGRTGMKRWTLGSVADRVLRARCTPLLLVRAR